MKKKQWRWLQRLTFIHRVHHPRWSFGWAFSLTKWVYFVEQTYKDDLDRDKIKVRPGHWEKCPKDSYHDCTRSGVY